MTELNKHFINPIKDGYLTSSFGWRTHPVTGKKNSWHQGVDIARQPNSNVEILASADGEVIRVGELGTYGYVVMIKHIVNGKRMETNYAHLKQGSIKVKVGQKVKQGQVIAIMGNTGSSTAPHLHFEIHDGQWLKNQPNAIDPEKYIKVYSKGVTLKMQEDIKKLQTLVAAQAKTIKEIEDKIKEEPKTTVATWANESWDWGKKNKITDGTRPQHSITRQEVVKMLHSLFTLLTNKK